MTTIVDQSGGATARGALPAARVERLRSLATTVRALSWQWHKQMMITVERAGMTVPQMALLGALNELGGRSTMGELVRLTCQSGATLTGIVDRLLAAGLVDRDRDDHDRRVVHVALTDAGRAKLGEVAAAHVADMGRVTAAMNDDDLQTLERLLQTYLAGSGAHPDDPPWASAGSCGAVDDRAADR
jgi:MarR family transcriptional regulator, organic hydroperoxide resistance regulator